MKLPTWLEAILAVGLLLMGYAWLKSHEALRDALAQQDVLKLQSKQLQDKIDAAGKAEQAANAALEAERNKPATIQTVARYLPAPLPQGSELTVQPDAKGTDQLVLTGDVQKNLQAIQGMEISCQECNNSLTARNSQLSDLQKQLDLSQQDAANWKKAAGKGSGFWTRAKEWGIRIGFAGGGYLAGRAVR